MLRLLTLTLLGLLIYCGPAASDEVGRITFVESWPEQTELDLPDLPDAPVLWREIMAGAGSRIDIASFYFSRLGDGKDAYGPEGVTDHLAPVLDEVARAATDRQVAVRVLADGKFNRTYPDVPAWLDGHDGIEARIFDVTGAWGSGVLQSERGVRPEPRVRGSGRGPASPSSGCR